MIDTTCPEDSKFDNRNITMTATVFHTPAARTLSERAWNLFSAFLMKIAEANIRSRSVEPFGL